MPHPKPFAIRIAKYTIGQIVRHRIYPFRGVFDIYPLFNNTEEWHQSIPARGAADQPFYHLFAENAETEYVAYGDLGMAHRLAGFVRQQVLLGDGAATTRATRS
jgi:hemimethylated DNA binding protein